MGTPGTPVTLQAGAQLTEDWFASSALLGPLSQALPVVNDQTTLPGILGPQQGTTDVWYAYPDPASVAGWSQETFNVGGAGYNTGFLIPCAAMVDGVLTAVVTQYESPSAAMAIQRDAQGNWTYLQGDMWAPFQSVSAVTAASSGGRVYIAGVSASKEPFLFMFDPPAGAWQPLLLDLLDSDSAEVQLSGDNLAVLAPADASTTEVRLWIADSKLGSCWFTFDAPTPVPNTRVTASAQGEWLTNSDLDPNLGAAWVTCCVAPYADLLIVRNPNGIVQAVGADGSATTLVPGSNAPNTAVFVTATVDEASATVTVFVTDDDNTTWAVRATPDGSGAFSYSPWSDLGITLMPIVSPPQSTGAAVYGFDITSDVSGQCRLLCQSTCPPPGSLDDPDAPDSPWYQTGLTITDSAAVPTGTGALDGNSYIWSVTAVDSNQSPVPSTQLTIGADRNTTIVCQGQSYQLGPNLTQQVNTGPLGTLEIRTVATGLSSPALVITADFLASGQTYRADGEAHKRLADEDQNFPMSATALSDAGLLNLNWPDPKKDAFVKKISNFGQAMAAKQPDRFGDPEKPAIDLSRIKGSPAWQMDFSDRNNPTIVDLDPADADALFTGAPGNWLEDAWGDFTLWLKEKWNQIENVAVHIVTEGIKIIVDGVHTLLTKVDDMADALEVLFMQAIEAVSGATANIIETVVTWLRTLFSWQDIYYTKQVISYLISTGLDQMSDSVEAVSPLITSGISTVFSDAVSSLQNAFGTSTVTSETPSDSPDWMGPGPQAPVLTATQTQNGPQGNYLLNRYTDAGQQAQTDLARPRLPGEVPSQWTTVLDTVTQTTDTPNFSSACSTAAATAGQNTNGGTDIAGALNTPLSTIAEAAVPVVEEIFAVAEELITDALDCVPAAIDGFNSLVSMSPFDVPILAWLLQQFEADAELTLLDMASWIIAAPTTILYKLTVGIDGLQAPFDANSIDELFTPLPWPQIGTAAGTDTHRVEHAPGDQVLLNWFGGIAGIVALTLEASADGMAAATKANPKDTVPMWLQILNPMANLVYSVLSSPLFFGTPARAENKGDDGAQIVWAASFAPVVADVVCLVYDGCLARNYKTSTNFYVGPLLCCAVGAVQFGFDTWGGVWILDDVRDNPDTRYNGFDVAAAFIEPATSLLKPLILSGWPLLICAADVVAGGSSVVINCLSNQPSSAAAAPVLV